MKQVGIAALLIIVLSSCYPKIEIEGFDRSVWDQEIKPCDSTHVKLAKLIVDQEELLLSKGQAEIKQFLGNPDEHELYTRNEKFFYYDLSKPDTCNQMPALRLSIRFDALDRAKNIMIIEQDQ